MVQANGEDEWRKINKENLHFTSGGSKVKSEEMEMQIEEGFRYWGLNI